MRKIILTSTLILAAFCANATSQNNSTKSPQKTQQAKKIKPKKKKKSQTQSTVVSNGIPRLNSKSAIVITADNNHVYINKNSDQVLPIASITKLMTAMVVLDSKVNLDDYVSISSEDVDNLRNTTSRLRVGMQLRRRDLLLLALMSSENRAASAIARTTFVGGMKPFIAQMNAKSKSLGMKNTKFFDPTGLTVNNQSTASDLAKMVKAAYQYDLIREDSTTKAADVMLSKNYTHRYVNSDSLVRGDNMKIEVSKTGFINEAGHCLVLYSLVANKPVIMVFLNSPGRSGRFSDALASRSYISRTSNPNLS
ncbi:MAG: serine hydrolase [Burkholderiales bacterium]|nr:serine hydrolase [Burkholderiales bacterium]